VTPRVPSDSVAPVVKLTVQAARENRLAGVWLPAENRGKLELVATSALAGVGAKVPVTLAEPELVPAGRTQTGKSTVSTTLGSLTRISQMAVALPLVTVSWTAGMPSMVVVDARGWKAVSSF